MTRTTPAAGADAVAAAARRREFADDVGYYLTQRPRQLPSRYLYDALGSAMFDAICELPWYRITRAETGLLAAHGPRIFQTLRGLERVVELGAGNGDKLAVLLDSRPPPAAPLQVDLVDVSRTALERATRAAAAFPGIRVTAYEATYEAGLERLARTRGRGPMLVLFLGSNIGNFDPPSADALLGHVRSCLRPGDALLLGADLVKPEPALLLAYDDPLGLTAAFNRNLLVRLTRELDADLDLGGFAHRAIWNAARSRVEMHLVSTRAQRLRVPPAAIDIAMAAGETIWTESSYKYEPAGVVAMLARAGFTTGPPWIDEDARFALALARV